jgi:PAS domain S-box-containing protein
LEILSDVTSIAPEWLVGGGEMGGLIRSTDWSPTPLGPRSLWPQSLRLALGICLNSQFPMLVWWGSDLISIYNDAYAPMLGRRHPHALGQSAKIIWPEMWPDVAPQIAAVFRGEASWNERRLLLLERNGYQEERYFTSSYSPVLDESGCVAGLFCAVMEETLQAKRAEQERVRLSAEVERQARIFDTTLSSITDFAYILDPDSRFRYANKALLDLWGLTLEQAVGKDFFDLKYPAELATKLHAQVRQVIQTRRRLSDETPYVSPTGVNGYYEYIFSPVFAPDGTVELVAGSTRDVTERKKAENEREQLLGSERAARSEAERASQMKDEFLATLSHELRTPLNAILGWAQILSGGNRDENDLTEGLHAIERNARAQTQIIEDLLDMSRIISGKVRLDVQPVDLANVVQASLSTVQPAANAKGVRLRAVLDPLVGSVSGDPNRLQQVFWNLLTNAVKFTSRGGRVQVVLQRVDSHVEVNVVDTGEGIDPTFLPHVFDRFRQADASTTRKHGGLGLGLAIVKQLVELHGGSAWAKSPGAGHGSTFTVSLPLTVLHADPEPASDRRHPAATNLPVPTPACAQVSGMKVLVVDDEPDARSLLKRVLEECKAVVWVAASAAEALQLVQSERPDVIASDVGMPGEDGYSLIRQIRLLPADRGGETPAVALTAYARPEDRVKAMMAGFQQHVSKPVQPAELIAMIASLSRRTK